MLLFDNVTKTYNDDITVLKNINIDIQKGEFTFLVGPSGAGKTTLVKLLIRDEVPTSGTIFFDHINVPKLPNQLIPKYRQRLGIVFQDLKLIETKTLAENIDFALEILGKSSKEIEQIRDYLLELVNLQDRRHLFPRQLSGGEQQRGAIARALASNPDLLVADEPTGNLDPDNAEQVLNILKNINNAGTTVMVITHDKNMVNEMQTRVIRLSNGQVVSDNKGGYDTVAKPVATEIPKAPKRTYRRKKVEEPTLMIDDNLQTLEPSILNKLLDNKITTIEEVLKLKLEDLQNLQLTAAEQKKLQEFLKNYLTQQK